MGSINWKGAIQVLPLHKKVGVGVCVCVGGGGCQLKGGHTHFLGSFNLGHLSFSNPAL